MIPPVDPNAINYISNYDIVYSPVSIGDGGGAQCYTDAKALFAASYAAKACKGPPFIDYLYDQNQGPDQHLRANFPAHCNWYGSVARAALAMHSLVRPSNTLVSSLLKEIINRTAAQPVIVPRRRASNGQAP